MSELQFHIVAIHEENASAKTYELAPGEKNVPSFVPGQFLTFILTIDRQEYRRSFSIISLPGEPLRITVKRVENGAVSRYILLHWQVGDRLTALPPAGRFTVPARPGLSRDIFFIVAGSGITPALPQLRSLLAQEPKSLVHLYYSNRSERERLFSDELRALSAANPKLQIRHFLSAPQQPGERISRLTNGNLPGLIETDLAFGREDAIFMICGPFAFMRMAWITLIYMGFEKQHIRRENFLPGIMRANTASGQVFAEQKVTIHKDGSSYSLIVKPGQSILRAALKAGIALPYSCEGGVCSTCAVRCSGGKVVMTINEVLTDKDLAEGWVLTCTGHPAGDGVVLKL